MPASPFNANTNKHLRITVAARREVASSVHESISHMKLCTAMAALALACVSPLGAKSKGGDHRPPQSSASEPNGQPQTEAPQKTSSDEGYAQKGSDHHEESGGHMFGILPNY